jgi:polar amino acid transport system substrate-binding protein
MRFSNILPSVQNQLVDIGVGGITITLERSKVIAFSIPYLLSYAQYIGLKASKSQQFSTNELSGKKIGVEAGSVFGETIEDLSLKNVNVVQIKTHAGIIQALQDHKIDYALMDASAAKYWQSQSSDKMVALGTPFLYGYGFGIAVNESNAALLEDINSALLEYQNNGGFQKAYNQYIAHF